MTMLRRFANALLGSGPWQLEPFETIARARTEITRGVHRAEDFTGTLHHEAGEPTLYPASLSLLDQVPTCELLPDGPRYRESGLAPACPRTVYSLTQAGVIGPDGLVYCLRTRRAVAETARQWTAPASDHPALGAVGHPAARHLPGLTLSLLTLSGEGFYHHLLEAIPRLQLLRPWLDQADHVLCAGAPDSLQARWLAHAGVPSAKIVWMTGLCHVSCDQLLFTSYPMRDQQPSAWTVRVIRAAFPPPADRQAGPRRIWISRRDARFRLLAWEDELLALLPGFTRVELAGLTPAAQIALAAGADIIAGPHGAGLAHALFGRPGAALVELFPLTHHQPIYARLAALAGLDHAWAQTDYGQPADLRALAAAIHAFRPLRP